MTSAPCQTERFPEAVFIADVHLDGSDSAARRALLRLLDRLRARSPRPHLYILGDLFDYWAGRATERSRAHRAILRDLAGAVEAGVPVTVLPGNRDFLLDGRIGALYGIDVRRRDLRLELGPFRVLACHGDRLLTRDVAHQRFRWVLQSFWMRALADVLPVPLVEWIAARLRSGTPRLTARKARAIFDIPVEEVARRLRGGYDVLICGHVHRECRRRVVIDDRRRSFFTLGSWEDQASVLEFDGAAFRFSSFPLE